MDTFGYLGSDATARGARHCQDIVLRISFGQAMREGPVRVSRWGDSLAVRLPRELVERMRLAEGDEVDVTALDRRAIGIARPDTGEEVLARLRALQRPAPEGFSWSRDEANER